MITLSREQTVALQSWFQPERPGPLIGAHVVHTGHGTAWVDRWPAPRAILVETAGNYSLLGEPAALTPAALKPHLAGFVEAAPAFEPLLRAAFPQLEMWQRLIFTLNVPPPHFPLPDGFTIRPLSAVDVPYFQPLSPEAAWISKTWGGAAGLAASGYAWGAFAADRLVSVACTFFLGAQYEEIGVATEPGFRGQGLSVACAAALCRDIQQRGRHPSWTTSPDNIASRRVAEKLGFAFQRHDLLYIIETSIPAPA